MKNFKTDYIIFDVGGRNKQGGGAKVPELINEKEGINKQGGTFGKTWRDY